MRESKTVKIFKALANPTRLSMVRRLASCSGGWEKCGDLSAKSALSQPTLSHHFGKLIESGIVIETKKGTEKSYGLNRKLLIDSGIDIKKI